MAVWGPPRVNILFSTAITPGVLALGNWFARFGNIKLGLTNATAFAPNRVQLTALGGGADPGPDVVSYSPPPFDVIGPGGPAAAFTDFPLT